jgi:hypothetical protein
MNSNKKIESAFSSSHWSEGNAHSAETQPLKRPRFEPNFEVKHGFALEDVDMNDVVDEIYALEVIMVITQRGCGAELTVKSFSSKKCNASLQG